MGNGKKKAISGTIVAAMALAISACGTESQDYTVSYKGIKTADVSSGVSVHDPSILQVDDTYYIFGSHMSAAKSTDLLNWERSQTDTVKQTRFTDRYMKWQIRLLRIPEIKTV